MAAPKQPPPDMFDDQRPEIPSGVAPAPRPKSLPPGAMSIARFASEPPSRPAQLKSTTRASVAKARLKVREMRESGDWSEATPSHLVALYEWFHVTVYGVEASELSVVREWTAASAAASRLLHDQFADDVGAMAAFMKWSWTREQEREQWRRANGRSGNRIGWRLAFSAALVTEWRLDRARRNPGFEK